MQTSEVEMEKKKSMKNLKAYKLVRAISDGDNVEAYKILEQTMKEKVAKKIDDAMKDA